MVYDYEIELDGLTIVRSVRETLRMIDKRLMEHGERVAFIACDLAEMGNLSLDLEQLCLMCLFHDIGAYKTDDIDQLFKFETENAQNHSVYGYLFLKYMTPLEELSKAILHHHTPWSELKHQKGKWKDYAALIGLADRIDIAYTYGGGLTAVKEAQGRKPELFKEEYVTLFLEHYEERQILERLSQKSFQMDNSERVRNFHISSSTAVEYLKMLVFLIDFRSEHTVTHSVNTIAIALSVARYFKLSDADQAKICLGALLHDVGKIAIPVDILECPGQLTAEQMKIMRTHVAETEKIIRGIVPDEICEIAIRHHEKLDGSGYPRHLKAEELDFLQRIVAIADIVSALGSRRSYKEPYPKEKTITVLTRMQGKELDTDICQYICNKYDEIMWETDASRNKVIQKYQTMMQEYRDLVLHF